MTLDEFGQNPIERGSIAAKRAIEADEELKKLRRQLEALVREDVRDFMKQGGKRTGDEFGADDLAQQEEEIRRRIVELEGRPSEL